MSGGNGIRVLLWDADGVLQHNEEDWGVRLDEVGGAGFADAVFAAELPALSGETSLHAALQQAVDAWPGPTPSVEEILSLWEQTVVDHDAMAVVDEVRARGVLTCLATNQQDHRVAWMTEQLDYPAHFDRTYWSSRIGLVKPDEEFFRHIVDDLGVDPGVVGFVDDSGANVAAARRVGIRAVRHDPASGAGVLRREVEELLDAAD
jgi:putative hydrolase of the HAD superfamily